MYEIGDDYLVGDDPVEALLMGAAVRMSQRRPMARPNSALSAALAARQAQQGAILKSAAPTKARKQVLGLPLTAVAAAAQATITANPQQLFRPERLVVQSSIASAFLINQFLIGRNNQFLSATAVPASMFTENAVGVGLKCDTAQVNMPVSVIVTNNSGAAANFVGAIVGEVVE